MKRFALLLFFSLFSVHLFAQTGYVRAQGKHLVDGLLLEKKKTRPVTL